MRAHYERIVDEPEFDPMMLFYVFMIVFWPTAVLLGFIDHTLIPDYDLRIPMMLLSLGAGWLGVKIYKVREIRKLEESS